MGKTVTHMAATIWENTPSIYRFSQEILECMRLCENVAGKPLIIL